MASSKPRETMRGLPERPVNVLEIHGIGGQKKSSYVLKEDKLSSLLAPIKDIEVVVIAVVGHCRRGKSFLLNYMCRYLNNYKNRSGWIGDGDQPLGGFGWKSSSDPQTFGLWLSKPFIVEQSNGKQIAVLLMDTQGLFDDRYSQRDWSTIVGTSLLVSSCLIFNVFTDISERELTTLDSYIEYGMRAVEANSGVRDDNEDKESFPFQALLFLVRDWNTPNEFKFGQSGGNKYLDKKLIVNDYQSVEAQNVRKNIKKCFKDIQCFLMPAFGEVMDSNEFNGSYNQLRDRFRDKLKEFIETLLNPEELVPKMSEDSAITGAELYQQFQTFVEVFNREELPESSHIIEANSKLLDTILIRKFKDQHMDQLRASINRKPFLTRIELKSIHEKYRTENVEKFENKMKSKNPKLVDKLYKQLDKNYEIVMNENEEKRDQYMEEQRDICGHNFNSALNSKLENNGSLDPEVLEEVFKELEKEAIDSFKACYSGEDKKLFQQQYTELSDFLHNTERATRLQNYKRMKEFEITKAQYENEIIAHYNQEMQTLLEGQAFLTKDVLKTSEIFVREETINKFKLQYNFGDESASETFFLKVEKKLDQSKLSFKRKNEENRQNIIKKTKEIVLKAVENYNNDMNEALNLIQTIDDLDKLEKYHQVVLIRVRKQMDDTLPYKAPEFLKQFLDIFNTETNKRLDIFRTELMQKQEQREKKYVTALFEAKEHYTKQMSDEFEVKSFLSNDELNKLHKKSRKSALELYDSHFEPESMKDQLSISFKLTLREDIESILEEFNETNEQNKNCDERLVDILLKQSIDTFNARISAMCESANSESHLKDQFTELKTNLKRQMADNDSIRDRSLVTRSIIEFETCADQIFDNIRAQMAQRRESILVDYKNKMTEAVTTYKQKMDKFINDNQFVTEEEFNEYHTEISSEVISYLKQHLKPVHDIDVDSYVGSAENSITEESDLSFKACEAKREQGLQLIRTHSLQYIEEYERRMKDNLDHIQVEAELQTRHEECLDEALDSARHSGEFKDKKLISIQLTYIEGEITELFQQISAQFRDKIGHIKANCESIFLASKTFYEEKMESLFQGDKFYSPDELIKHQSKSRAETLKHFQDQLEGNSLPALKRQYLDQLSEFVAASSDNYKQKNETLMNKSIENNVEVIKQKYSKTLKEEIESLVLTADVLNDRHNELTEQLVHELHENIPQYVNEVESYQDQLKSFMDKELSVIHKRLSEKTFEIIESYKSIAKLLIVEYSNEMEYIATSDGIFNEEEFLSFEKVHRNDVINQFETHLKENPCNETQNHFLQFKTSLDNVLWKIKEKFDTKCELKNKNLKIAVEESAKMYETEMKINLDNIKNMDQLKECDKNVREKVMRMFMETHQFGDKTQMQSHVESLVENFDNSFIDFEVILELRIEKQETLTKNLRLDFRRFFKEEMQKFFQNKRYIKQPLLEKYRKAVLKESINKFTPDKGELSGDSFKNLAEESIDDIFIKFVEENEMRKPTDSPAIGIDLGTTNSCVAYYKPDANNANYVVVIPNEIGFLTTPSVVSYRDNGQVSVGQDAKDEIHSNPRNTITSNKRLIGRRFDDENVQNDMNLWSYRVVNDGNNNPMISVKVDEEDVLLHPEQVSAQVLKVMKQIAESHLGCEVSKAVITVPAYFTDSQKEATKHAGRIAGLQVLRIINEPTAAAIAFKVDRNDEKEIRNVLIYDFGGGTFDVSFLEINRGQIIVKAVGGDNHLGGDDIDTNMIKYCLEQFFIQHRIRVEGVEGEAAMCRLRNACEVHKKKLTSVQTTTITIDNFYRKLDLRVVLTREKFVELNYSLFIRSIDLVKTTLNNIGVNPSDIDDVVLVGGTTRIPKVQELLSQFFRGKPLNHWINPDEAVAKGAAIQAAYLNGQQMSGSTDLELKDVTPLSLGIRIKGGKMSTIVPRNSPVPTKFTKQYYTSEDYQTVVGIKIYEGEKPMANDNDLLGQFDLSGIPRALQGEQPIDVTFSLNDEGILHVNAKIVSTGGENEIEITEHKGRLTTEMIEQLIEQDQSMGNIFNDDN